MENVLVMILAGGSSEHLPVLTAHRSKAALPFGGRFRVIDFCLSNCMHSQMPSVGILAQYNPASLILHIGDGSQWDLNRHSGGIAILQPYTARGETNWFRGTADSLAQYIDFIRDVKCEHVLVISGDQIYKMDYRQMISHHTVTGSDVTIAIKPSEDLLPLSVGGVAIDGEARVIDLKEKPQRDNFSFYSLGIYAFTKKVLVETLEGLRDGQFDIVFDVLIPLIEEKRVKAYIFDSYWADVGAVDRYFETSMGLLRKPPALDLNDDDWRIYTKPSLRKPAFFGRTASVENSLVASGCTIMGNVRHSILFPGVKVNQGAVVENSILFEDVVVGKDCVIRSTVVDRRAHIGNASFVGFGNPTCPNSHYPDSLSSGITIVGSDTHVPQEIRIGRNCLIGSDLSTEYFPGRDIVCGESLVRETRWQKISS